MKEKRARAWREKDLGVLGAARGVRLARGDHQRETPRNWLNLLVPQIAGRGRLPHLIFESPRDPNYRLEIFHINLLLFAGRYCSATAGIILAGSEESAPPPPALPESLLIHLAFLISSQTKSSLSHESAYPFSFRRGGGLLESSLACAAPVVIDKRKPRVG